jgi:hypothetical protein
MYVFTVTGAWLLAAYIDDSSAFDERQLEQPESELSQIGDLESTIEISKQRRLKAEEI